jgi:hypothetical protein
MSLKFILFNSLGYSVYRTGEKQAKYKTPSALFMQKRKEKGEAHGILPEQVEAPLSPRKPPRIKSEVSKGTTIPQRGDSSMSPAEGGKQSRSQSRKRSENWNWGHFEQKWARAQC